MCDWCPTYFPSVFPPPSSGLTTTLPQRGSVKTIHYWRPKNFLFFINSTRFSWESFDSDKMNFVPLGVKVNSVVGRWRHTVVILGYGEYFDRFRRHFIRSPRNGYRALLAGLFFLFRLWVWRFGGGTRVGGEQLDLCVGRAFKSPG